MGVDLPAYPGLVAAGQRAGLALEAVADFLHVRPYDLAVVIEMESFWNPLLEHPSTHATGLIQWLPSTAVRLGMAPTEDAAPGAIKKLDAEQQIYLIPDFYAAALGRRDPSTWPSAGESGVIDIGDLYLLIFAPSFAGATSGTIWPKGSDEAARNQQLVGPDGAITVESVRDRLERLEADAGGLPRIATDTWAPPPPYKPPQPGQPPGQPPRPGGGSIEPPKPAAPPSSVAWLLLILVGGGIYLGTRKRRRVAA
jgi:hypothetical protein